MTRSLIPRQQHAFWPLSAHAEVSQPSGLNAEGPVCAHAAAFLQQGMGNAQYAMRQGQKVDCLITQHADATFGHVQIVQQDGSL